MAGPDLGSRRDRVLVVCTANQCRSPMTGAVLLREVHLHGLPVDVATAGFSPPGQPATPPTRETAGRAGLDLSGHRSRQVAPELLLEADLVIGMERRHVREAVVLAPSVWRRTFTLPDLVRRAEGRAPRAPGESLRVWAEDLSAGRDRQSMMGSDPRDEVRDPTADRSVDHVTTLELIDDLVRRVVRCAWPA